MPRQRRHFPPEQKVALLRLHLLEKKPVSDICQEHNLSVNLFYLWQKQFFDNGTAAFENTGTRRKAQADAKDRTIAALQDKLRVKNDVLAELMEEHVRLKKELGEP
jgi:transposase